MISSSDVTSDISTNSSFGSIVGYFQSLWFILLESLGLSKKSGIILVLGLDNAGKTTLLFRLKCGTVRSMPPTDRPTSIENFEVDGVTFRGWDLGGHEAVRHLWEDYIPEASAIAFLVDASDPTRLEEAALELDALVDDATKFFNVNDGATSVVPLAILLNKCDLETALPSDKLAADIGYTDIVRRFDAAKKNILGNQINHTSIHCSCEMFRISVLRGEGYHEAFRWIATFL